MAAVTSAFAPWLNDAFGVVDSTQSERDLFRARRVERVVLLQAVDREDLLPVVDVGETERRLDVALGIVDVVVAHRLAETVAVAVEDESVACARGSPLSRAARKLLAAGEPGFCLSQQPDDHLRARGHGRSPALVGAPGVCVRGDDRG